MPVINLDISDLQDLVGEGFSLERFRNEIPMIGACVEKEDGREIAVEFFPNRPDLYSVEGVARAYRRFSGLDDNDLFTRMTPKGSSGIRLTVDPALETVRPVMGCAFVRGVTVDERALVSIMNLQEKLHLTTGRNRRKVAIGIHDAAPLEPPFRFWAALPDEVSFVPLQKSGEWSLARILKEHEKGKDFAWVLEGMNRYPVITDSKGQVLSFPPVINGELTRVTEATKDIFVDCTGWDLKAVSIAVNIVCSQLSDRGGTIETVDVEFPELPGFQRLGLRSGTWPEYSWGSFELDLGWCRSWLGKDLTGKEVVEALHRMGYEGVKAAKGSIKGKVPPWRGDILHQADIAEDVAIGHGFLNFNGSLSKRYTTASEKEGASMSRLVKDVLVGLSFLEVRTIALSNETVQFGLLGRKEMDHIRIVNPISTEHTMVRPSAIPTLLQLLRTNKHRDLPQRIFEVADGMVRNENVTLLTALSENPKASFSEMKGIVQRLMSDLNIPYVLGINNLNMYIRGRGAALYTSCDVLNGNAYQGPFPELYEGHDVPIGHFGELHPRVLSEMEVPAPVSAMEMDLSLMSKLKQ